MKWFRHVVRAMQLDVFPSRLAGCFLYDRPVEWLPNNYVGVLKSDCGSRTGHILGGDTWDTGGGLWLVLLRRGDGKVVAISDEAVNLYNDEEELQTGKPRESIVLV
ncbi:MAG TPA: hypothetical protein VHZ28_15835 [Terracidiphilus sp.]|jgi:hypothetical protein|nr:hypothetical protein [Terracidiphilus sp.]